MRQLRAPPVAENLRRSDLSVCSLAPPTELEAKERVMEDMRLALTEQEETQSQMEEVLEEKLQLIRELSSGETPWFDRAK